MRQVTRGAFLLFNNEEGGEIFFRNFGRYSTGHTLLYPRRCSSIFEYISSIMTTHYPKKKSEIYGLTANSYYTVINCFLKSPRETRKVPFCNVIILKITPRRKLIVFLTALALS
jgi:hypothetical protein